MSLDLSSDLQLFPRSLSKPLGIAPSAPLKMGITVPLMFYNFLTSLSRSMYLSLFHIIISSNSSSIAGFSHQRKLVVFQWSLSNSKFSQVSRTLLGNLADHSNAVVWMVSARPLISKSFSSFTTPFCDFSECTNYHWYYHHLQISWLFSSLPRSKYLSLILLSFIFIVLLLFNFHFYFQFLTDFHQDFTQESPWYSG